MTLLQIKNIDKSFNKKNGNQITVLKNIKLTINNNEFVTIIGPSGCGKSTLLNLVAGLVKPDNGQLYLNGNKIKTPGKDRVMVFQEAALFPWLSVINNVMFGLKNNHHDKQEALEKAEKQLDLVHLEDFKDTYPHQLSGGMKQRVAIARALVMNPEILLMDEPFGALDEQTRLMQQRELIEIWLKTRKTIIFVTHNIREAVKLSDRIIVMGTKPGQIIEEFKINYSRPRQRNNQHLINIENQILNILEDEIEKSIIQEKGEFDYEKAGA